MVVGPLHLFVKENVEKTNSQFRYDDTFVKGKISWAKYVVTQWSNWEF